MKKTLLFVLIIYTLVNSATVTLCDTCGYADFSDALGAISTFDTVLVRPNNDGGPGLYVDTGSGPSTKNREWKEAFFILDVPVRDSIICGHIANNPNDLLGCMGFGLHYYAPDHIIGSTKAIYKWRDSMTGIDEFELRITE